MSKRPTDSTLVLQGGLNVASWMRMDDAIRSPAYEHRPEGTAIRSPAYERRPEGNDE